MSYSRSAGLIINEHFKPGKPTKVTFNLRTLWFCGPGAPPHPLLEPNAPAPRPPSSWCPVHCGSCSGATI